MPLTLFYTKWLFKEIREKDYIDENTYNVYMNGLIDGNLNEINEYEQDKKYTKQVTGANKRKEIDKQLNKYNEVKGEYDRVFIDGKSWQDEVRHYNTIVDAREGAEGSDYAQSFFYEDSTPDNDAGGSYPYSPAGWEAFKSDSKEEVILRANNHASMEVDYKNIMNEAYLGEFATGVLDYGKSSPDKEIMTVVANAMKDYNKEGGAIPNLKGMGVPGMDKAENIGDIYLAIAAYTSDDSIPEGQKKAAKARWNKFYSNINAKIKNASEQGMDARKYFDSFGIRIDKID